MTLSTVATSFSNTRNENVEKVPGSVASLVWSKSFVRSYVDGYIPWRIVSVLIWVVVGDHVASLGWWFVQ
jgi:hypothetical protein